LRTELLVHRFTDPREWRRPKAIGLGLVPLIGVLFPRVLDESGVIGDQAGDTTVCRYYRNHALVSEQERPVDQVLGGANREVARRHGVREATRVGEIRHEVLDDRPRDEEVDRWRLFALVEHGQ